MVAATLKTDVLTVVPTAKVVKEVIGSLKEIASLTEREQEAFDKMQKVRKSLETDYERFMDVFVEEFGIYHLQECLRSPFLKVVQQVFEIVPHFFSFQAARHYIKGKLDFFTALYEFMDHPHLGIRTAVCQMFNQIFKRLPRGNIAFTLTTKAAINQA